MKGFIVTSHYTFEGNQANIHLFGRLENGKSFEAVVQTQPYFFIQKTHVTQAKELLSATITETTKTTLQGEAVSKILLDNPKEIPALRQVLEDNNIPCYEADIPFTRRYFMDKHILGVVDINGESQEGKYTDTYFFLPEITPVQTLNHIPQPTILSIDIETTKDMKEILSIALKQETHEEVLVIQNTKLSEARLQKTTLVENEQELLTIFVQRVQALDPDIITGWHVIDFDLDLLAQRAKQFAVPFLLGRTEQALTVRKESSFFRDSKAYCQGRIILDGLQLLKSSFIKLEDYKLNTAAKEILGDSKLIEEDDRFELIEESYHTDPRLFVEYNLKDADLVLRILEKSGVLELTIQRSLLTGIHMDGVKASIASFDSLYIRELNAAGHVAPSTRPRERDEGMGGFVMASKPGIYSHVLVLDFKSLYPSLMRTFNIDPVAYVGQSEEFTEKELEQKEKYIVAPNHAVLKNEQGILPALLTTLWSEREKAKQQGNELARFAIKILMNSMYGVLASPNSRFHNRKLSNAITSFGQFFIKLTAEKIEELGHRVIYGDTDSVFVHINLDNEKEVYAKGKELEAALNTFLQNYIRTEYARESILELEFEKHFLKFFMPTVRGSTSGAKKRYAGLRKKEDESTYLDVTGLEIVRSDWTELAKTFQEQLLYKAFAGADIASVIRNFVEDLRAGKLDEQLLYRKSLRKSLDKYTKTTPPHVKAARLLKKLDSNIIYYYITIDGPQPQQNRTAPIDYEHYVEKQLKPIATSILEVIGKNFDDVLKKSEQTGLGAFM